MAGARDDFEAARRTGDVSRAAIYAGQASGLIDSSLPAKAIIEGLMKDAEEALRTRTESLL
jgi:NAD(P)H-dependent flavin oxidoreductase YrpB (nitropropane dioxygenase family)